MKRFGEVFFTFEDMESTHPDLTEEEFNEKMATMEERLITSMVAAGWSVLDEIFPIKENDNDGSNVPEGIEIECTCGEGSNGTESNFDSP